MDIQEFITETLNQITTSVENNSSSLNTDNIAAYEVAELKNINTVQSGFVTSVEFDMAVTESTSKDGGAKLSIAGLGSVGGDLATGSKTVSRIKFSVPLHIKPKSQ
ncbi:MULTISPECIES: hypothetical protein [unclassified Pseudoalteromonas]|uniref:hypothetical protein n=1 Tax=unclassified Pseudoalteromonas TaxID=194690 RepID=UPI0004276404|nr:MULTISPECIES: hypothetical protein [unclassified Pseudoalteromonas]MDC9498161.1 hypothetical protein [Pseudoalteromonas sp. Angola-20]MDC9516169.1 hypothetical protein [Pseudoalteromonas sp. Angola-22]MDC9532582.1 hypothetical protein [Pseudoalteromonas sp. Angola-9]TMP82682.1 hypothetical protein CWB71_09190 [Pseudoalteromonas sp. S983]|tara:strand:- start:85 stop:402 length:318 start_codon:yes stop_codon:yes gene_type:complete